MAAERREADMGPAPKILLPSDVRAPGCQLVRLEEILGVVGDREAVLRAIANGFVALSTGRVVVAPVVHMGFRPQGDCCIKAGYIKGDQHFVVKVAAGCFSGNRELVPPLPTNTGVMLLFSQRTGMLEGVLLDEGYLTELRTAAAGAVAAKYLGPRVVKAIGVIGCGVQARFQLDLLRAVTDCKHVHVWGRDRKKLDAFADEVHRRWEMSCEIGMGEEGLQRLGAACNLIVCATTSRSPLLFARHVRPGTHITAMGADGIGKQELDASVLAAADLVVADSRAQCFEFGDISHGLKEGSVSRSDVRELGEVIAEPSLWRRGDGDDRITVFDSTGVAVQDVAISAMAFAAARPGGSKTGRSRL